MLTNRNKQQSYANFTAKCSANSQLDSFDPRHVPIEHAKGEFDRRLRVLRNVKV